MQSKLRTIVVVFSPILAFAAQIQQSPSRANTLLKQADRLMAQGDRYRAAPLYRQAELLFRLEQNGKGETEAQLGKLRASTDQGDYQSLKEQAGTVLQKRIVQNDVGLKIKALALVGLIDLNIDTAAAREDFSELLSVATAAHDLKWENRARGELALLAGVNGDVAEAGRGLFRSIATAQRIGDVEGAFYFTLWLANGMSINGMADGALKQLEKADQLAKESGFEATPLALTIAHIRAIANLPEEERQKRLDESEHLYSEAFRLAQKDVVPGAEVELLTQHGELALAAGNRVEAENSFYSAVAIARKSALPSLEVESAMALAEFLLSNNEPEKARRILDRSIYAAHKTPDRLELPRYLGIQAPPYTKRKRQTNSTGVPKPTWKACSSMHRPRV